jgi:hypothetical protein
MCGTLKMNGQGAGLLFPTPCRYAKEMFIMKWHSAIVWLLLSVGRSVGRSTAVPVYRLAAQLFAVPHILQCHKLKLPPEADISGGLLKSALFLARIGYVCLSVAVAAFTHL